MGTFLSDIEVFFTKSISWMGQILDFVTDNPALTVLILAMPIAGYAVRIFRSLIHS